MDFLSIVQNELHAFIDAKLERDKAKEAYYSTQGDYRYTDWSYYGAKSEDRLRIAEENLATALQEAIENR